MDTFYLKHFAIKTNRSSQFEKDSYLHRTEHSVGIQIINNYQHHFITDVHHTCFIQRSFHPSLTEGTSGKSLGSVMQHNIT